MGAGMKEIWKDIKGYEGVYKVSNLGQILSVGRSWVMPNMGFNVHKRKPKILKQQIDKDGYKYIHLWYKRKQKFYHTHTLVASAFIPNPEKKPQVNHINGNKTDNRVENLEWNTVSENVSHAFSVLKRKPSRQSAVKCIETNIVYKSATEASKRTGINLSCISMAARKVKRKVHNHDCTHKTAGGYHWEYLSTLE